MRALDAARKLRKLASLDETQAKAGWLLYLFSEGEERRGIDELLDVLLWRSTSKGFGKQIHLEPPPPAACDGNYMLGMVLYPPQDCYGPFGLREDDWLRHVLITGMTGTGKTNLAFHILRELRRHQKPFLVFDWKRNYRDLLQLPEFERLRVFTPGRSLSEFRFNPLIPPPGTGHGEWLMKLVDVIKHAYFVGAGVEFVLREAIDWVYEQCGCYAEMLAIPSFEPVKEYVARKHLQGRMSLWKASAMRVLGALCFRHGLGPVLNTADNLHFEALLEQDAVLELEALADADKTFLAEALILWIYEYRKAQPGREVFRHALVIEEGHHVLSLKKESRAGAETIMETCLRQVREFGESVIVVDQEPSKLSNSIKANAHTKISFALGHPRDTAEMMAALGVAREDEDANLLLGIGEGLAAVHGRIPSGVLVAFPQVKVRKGAVTDARLEMLQGK